MARNFAGVWLGAVLATLLIGCGGEQDKPVDLQLFAAVYDTDPGAPPPAGWQRVTFEGNLRSRAVSVLVGSEPLLTGWNIVTFHAAEETDGSRAISIRLNAAGQKKMRTYGADETRVKQPLALRIDGRWCDVSPLLANVTDRMTLYGLTAQETERLEQWIQIR